MYVYHGTCCLPPRTCVLCSVRLLFPGVSLTHVYSRRSARHLSNFTLAVPLPSMRPPPPVRPLPTFSVSLSRLLLFFFSFPSSFYLPSSLLSSFFLSFSLSSLRALFCSSRLLFLSARLASAPTRATRPFFLFPPWVFGLSLLLSWSLFLVTLPLSLVVAVAALPRGVRVRSGRGEGPRPRRPVPLR